MADKKRRQVSLWVQTDFFDAVELIRQRSSPIPTASEVIRQAVLDKAAAMEKQAERKRASR